MTEFKTTALRQLTRRKRSGELSLIDLYRKLTELIPVQTEATRSSIWHFHADRDSIICQDLFDSRTGEHGGGMELFAADYTAYFAVIRNQGTLVADNAHEHPATACFSETYFDPFGIEALLDVVIRIDDRPIGIICSEHCDEPRFWTEQDIAFSRVVAEAIASILETEP